MHKKFRSVYYPSPQQAWVAPGNTKLEFKNWVPPTDQNGNRTIIDGFEIHATFNVTVATAAIDARDLWRLMATLTIQQQDGTMRFNEIPGDALRVLSYLLLGAERTREQYSVATGTNTITASFYVPLWRPFMEEPYEYSMPAEVFSLVRVGMATNAYMSLGTSVVTLNSGTYWVVAECHAESRVLDANKKPTIKSYAIDLITTNDFPAVGTTQLQINVSGRPTDQILYVPAVGGGAPLTTGQITQANVVGLYSQSQFVYPDLVTRYAREREWAPGLFNTTNQSPLHTDPFVPDPADGTAPNAATNPRAVALLFSTGNHPDEGPVASQLTLNFIETAAPSATPRVITRTLVPRNTQLDAAQGTQGGRGKTRKTVRQNGTSIAPADAAYFSATLHN